MHLQVNETGVSEVTIYITTQPNKYIRKKTTRESYYS